MKPSILCCALALALLAPRAAHANGVSQILLDDGDIVLGEVLSVETGAHARVKLEDGSVRELAWADIRTITNADGTRTPLPTSVVQLEATGAAMAIAAPGSGTLCTTPCTLRLPVGTAWLYVGGYRRTGISIQLPVTAEARRYVFFSAPRRNPIGVLPLLPIVLGFDTVMTGVLVAGAYCLNNCNNRGPSSAGAALLGAGAASFAILGPITAVMLSQFVKPRTGVARVEPLMLSAGPIEGGFMGSLAGTF